MTSPVSDSAPAAKDGPSFAALALAPAVQQVLADVGYESPSPIQAATIPPLLDGRDVLGQAQTGTGKTAAFALPILSRLDAAAGKPQALVLAPTRELAIQVAEAFQRYAAHIPGFRVLPIYGGQGYGPQLQGLRRGVHVVVGTPGRVVDHLKKKTLDLSALRFLVLDEADEMLKMGFAEDVEAVLTATPKNRQVALFSATMPAPIKRIAQTHLSDPVEVAIAAKTTTATNIRQRYWWVSGVHKLDALTRILEAEPFDAMIVFARTKQATEELATKLQARGFAAAAINGDIAQPQRERVIGQLKDGQLDILVATDVAARGLDVERISHVLNYDIPYDTESYVHRIGRTGRAGRSGEAILFVTPREKGMLRAIERATRQPIEQMHLPGVEVVNDRRITRFMERIDTALESDDLQPFRDLVARYESERGMQPSEVAAALARIAHGDKPLLLKESLIERAPRKGTPDDRGPPGKRAFDKSGKPDKFAKRHERAHVTEAGKETYRLEVGHTHGIKPGNIIGAIANEAGLDSQFIGRLTIQGDHSLIDLPPDMPKEILAHLKKVRVAGRMLQISAHAAQEGASGPRAPGKRPHASSAKPKKKGKPAGKPHGKAAAPRKVRKPKV
ncbi:DEAD/DEAH box helicase [Oleiagrimonas soli]|uniref:ATP-dependent RNA helicase DeaD n=1 Tax=Oleiagrimonas soli TaxID=1543381 RepID=A0A099CXV0_9GAMM|nr:DEAD/DEAH box helicase [Oleiagrimonas soli]KGI78823.1 RNA helicase [Oleiagrimonas soli]MBB6184390.1 ATP-dependent RNA helicase DeaD [Oleiagrimonas soli]